MSLTTKSRRRKDRVPSDTFTGIRTRSAAIAIGPNILNLMEVKRIILASSVQKVQNQNSQKTVSSDRNSNTLEFKHFSTKKHSIELRNTDFFKNHPIIKKQ